MFHVFLQIIGDFTWQNNVALFCKQIRNIGMCIDGGVQDLILITLKLSQKAAQIPVSVSPIPPVDMYGPPIVSFEHFPERW